MDALLLPLIAAALAEIGDRTMLLAGLLATRFGRRGPVLAGIAVAAGANAVIAAAGGAIVATFVPHRGIALMLALALAGAGLGCLLRARRPEAVDGWRLGAFASSALAFFILQFGEQTSFLAFAFAAYGGAPILAGAGAALGTILVATPAVALGAAMAQLPLRSYRLAAGALLLLTGLRTALTVLQLI